MTRTNTELVTECVTRLGTANVDAVQKELPQLTRMQLHNALVNARDMGLLVPVTSAPRAMKGGRQMTVWGVGPGRTFKPKKQPVRPGRRLSRFDLPLVNSVFGLAGDPVALPARPVNARRCGPLGEW